MAMHHQQLQPLHVEQRPEWHTYFMHFALVARTRSSCLRRQVGAVIVKDRMVLATGYNGAPRGLPEAKEVGCLRNRLNIPSGQRHELCRGLHAEQNAIVQAARHGIAIAGGVIYSTTYPCAICIKMIINAGLEHVYYYEGYPDQLTAQIVQEAGFLLTHLPVSWPHTETPQHPRRSSLPILVE